jgi:hypothetical protein
VGAVTIGACAPGRVIGWLGVAGSDEDAAPGCAGATVDDVRGGEAAAGGAAGAFERLAALDAVEGGAADAGTRGVSGAAPADGAGGASGGDGAGDAVVCVGAGAGVGTGAADGAAGAGDALAAAGAAAEAGVERALPDGTESAFGTGSTAAQAATTRQHTAIAAVRHRSRLTMRSPRSASTSGESLLPCREHNVPT